jgi:hypothetical protein
MTYFTPGIVIDVSAIFVAKTIFRTSSWMGRNAFICKADGKPAYNGHISTLESKINKRKYKFGNNLRYWLTH